MRPKNNEVGGHIDTSRLPVSINCVAGELWVNGRFRIRHREEVMGNLINGRKIFLIRRAPVNQ